MSFSEARTSKHKYGTPAKTAGILFITGGGGDINYLSPEHSVHPGGLIADGPDEIRTAIRMLTKAGIFLVPTIYFGDYFYEYQTLRSQDKNDSYIENERVTFLEAVGRAHNARVKVVVHLDFDVGAIDPSVNAQELAVFVEAGISPMDAIQVGTRVAAALPGWDDRLRTIERINLASIVTC